MSPEEPRLLEHSYDGIQEFDNPLPGWWKWILWASIVYSVLYVMYFHIGVGTSIYEDFDQARADFFAEQEALYADLEINEATIANLALEVDLMGAMGNRFNSLCATCHGTDASGKACPNLTDEFWLHGGTRMEIYETIRDGVKGKSMKAWLNDLGPVGVLQMSAYIDSIRGRDLPGRAPEGKPIDPSTLVIPEVGPADPQGEKEE